jgi:3-methyladenine DNA glycosylase AlkD
MTEARKRSASTGISHNTRPDVDDILKTLRGLGSPRDREGMARFGINVEGALGIGVTQLRKLARQLPKDHDLAQRLWATGIHEARILASIVDVPSEVTGAQMEAWAAEFNSWDLVDQCCGNLFDKTPYAWTKAAEWSEREEQFVKRAGFSLMAYLAVHDKKASDSRFEKLLPIIEREATDERNFVKKAVNWALRQIGKRNARLNGLAIKRAERIKKLDSKAARWIASDALRELKKPSVQQKLHVGSS